MGKRNKAANPSDPRNKVGNQGAPKNMPDSIPKHKPLFLHELPNGLWTTLEAGTVWRVM